MPRILIRLTIIYIFTLCSFRFMGKRQVGQLQLSELVCAIFISEIASVPITDTDYPLLYAIFPIALIVSGEVIFSYLSTKFSFFKRMFDSPPEILIRKGNLSYSAMEKARITVEELLGEARCQGVPNLDDIYYAILESNGKISIIQKSLSSPPTRSDIKVIIPESGIDHAVIIDGKINVPALRDVSKNEDWIHEKISLYGFGNVKEVFLMTVDENDKIYIVGKRK